MPDNTLKSEQVQGAIKAMMDKAMQTPNEPVAMAIVDAAGNLPNHSSSYQEFVARHLGVRRVLLEGRSK